LDGSAAIGFVAKIVGPPIAFGLLAALVALVTLNSRKVTSDA
jgi:hypothetical protein